jgi:hypothetical protein
LKVQTQSGQFISRDRGLNMRALESINSLYSRDH